MKTCPRCQSITFDDMEVCYGCLHRFKAEEPPAAVAEESTLLESMPYPIPAELSELPDGTVLNEVSGKNDALATPGEVARHLGASIEESLAALADFAEAEPELAESPRKLPEEFYLCIDDGQAVTRYRFSEGHPLVVGRSRACDAQIADPTVSRRHVRVGVRGEEVVLEDLGSSNPTYVDGKPLVDSAVIALGAYVTVARAKLWAERASAAVSR